MKKISIADRCIGLDQPCLIVAEIGINHNGDIGLARKMIEEAEDCGADAVKFQNYRTKDFIYDRSLNYSYQCRGKKVTEKQFEMFKRCELNQKQLFELKGYSDEIGIIFSNVPRI